jgi:tRNA/rRNA methyltransferase
MQRKILDNVVVILAGTKHPGNIGSVARAMHNMGLAHLRLASPQCARNQESERLACGGKEVLENAREYGTLKSALRGIHLLVGTTGKTGGNRSQTWSPRALAPKILAHAATAKAGILFGPEDTGLVDDDLLPCQMLMRIPTDPRARSINLAQAVMIVSYELFVASLEKEPARVPDLASTSQVEAMYVQMEEALSRIGFLKAQNARHMMFALRRMLGRAGLETSDVGILRGIARQIAWFGRVKRKE